ncbi:HD domain-containing phosphohydrolase [Planctomycetota bacterium]
MPLLRIEKGDQSGSSLEITEESLTIGRDQTDGIRIKDQGASRQHAEIFRIGELFFIRDLDSKNGTFLNEEPITEQALQVGDKIRVGATVFVFEDDGGEDADQIARRIEYDTNETAPSSTIEIDFSKDLRREFADNKDESKQLQVMMKISKLMGVTHSVQDVYEKVLKMLLEAIDADNGYIFELKDKGGLKPIMVVEKESDSATRVSKSIIKLVIDNHKAILTQDAAMDPRFKTSSSIIMRKTSGVICAPLIALDEMVGVIYISVSRVGLPFESRDLELVSAVAILLGMVQNSVTSARKEKENLMSTVKVLVGLTERRFPRLKGHVTRVVKYADAIGKQMRASGEQLFQLRLAAWLHDIGRIASTDDADIEEDPNAPEDLVRKRAIERAKRAKTIAEDMRLDERVCQGIVHHGETLDGKGTPDGLYGLDIPLFARIISVAKRFDMLVSFGGPQGDGIPIKDALMAINKLSGKTFDAEMVQGLLVAYRKGALFKTGETG